MILILSVPTCHVSLICIPHWCENYPGKGYGYYIFEISGHFEIVNSISLNKTSFLFTMTIIKNKNKTILKLLITIVFPNMFATCIVWGLLTL